MDNLVQQLRSLARSEHDDLSLGSAAADEIESLRQQLAECEKTIARLHKIETAARETVEDWVTGRLHGRLKQLEKLLEE